MGLESQKIYPYDSLEPISRQYGLTVVASSLFTFFILNRIVNLVGPPKSIRSNDTWKWTNLFCSWTHALIVGSWDLSCFILYPEMVTDLIAYQDLYSYTMIAVSTGYFFYDFCDIVLSKDSSSGWEVLLHHVAVGGIFFYNLMQSRCIAYTVVALLAEVNSFFLHSRKMMQLLHVPFSARLYRVNVYMNIATFTVCRFFAMAWIIYGMIVFRDRVSEANFYGLCAAMSVMWIINIILFWRIVANDLLRKSDSKPHSNGVKMVANNNGSQHNQNGSYDKLVYNGDSTYLNSTISNQYISNGYKAKSS